jgi:hypothetical protein
MVEIVVCSLLTVIASRCACQQIDKNYIVFSPKPKTKETTKIFTVTNTSNMRIRCTVEMDSNELYSNSRYTFIFVPESFTLDKVLQLSCGAYSLEPMCVVHLYRPTVLPCCIVERFGRNNHKSFGFD